mmetsp:Transcript_3323/g.3885  ORF Transcript_3323/g.3885 Transcript_3323/m.3885 type:complete len:101 (+) Transcript_3323:1004-1306(+)|eukprot:CAMPEP_0170459160 /NCGR_PEP_ID=MMETSP0123-20130129/5945_1 /TAXON_ID=182087 /ORGANISM="Favella ehrenbergii, Strain Fehren 1" /LENGTH=100 /DNA_ID=CAMNT_0010723661 /DNA_START=881 /DNA_END=1183 /DNA_ORIENTATION=+
MDLSDTTVAADGRYSTLFSTDAGSQMTKPNEYDIQTFSSVLEKLEALPLYNQYVPDAPIEKKALLYDLIGRPTLSYDPNCGKSISDAVSVLDEMQKIDKY